MFTNLSLNPPTFFTSLEESCYGGKVQVRNVLTSIPLTIAGDEQAQISLYVMYFIPHLFPVLGPCIFIGVCAIVNHFHATNKISRS